ncbi:TRAP transporter small permease [Hominifimenecus sp. rT4P-3]|uniref:TRAP transporter small permease n=1 Tax=Hominifimenecus sp. rT4P-3 TaxID=3242979 RepID=UPI003DA2E633
MKKILQMLDQHLEEWLLTFFLGLIAAIMLLQVVMRYLFGNALAWPEEVCRYLYIWSCFLGISYCISQGTELRIDLFEKLFRGKAKKGVQILLQGICVILYMYLFYTSLSVFQHVYETAQLSSAARIPMYLVYLSIPVSLALAVARGVQQVVRIFGRKEQGKNTEEKTL